MGARQRLNSMYLTGVLVIAAIVGGAANSWAVFLVVSGILTATAIHGGDIRLSPTAPRPTPRRHPKRRKR